MYKIAFIPLLIPKKVPLVMIHKKNATLNYQYISYNYDVMKIRDFGQDALIVRIILIILYCFVKQKQVESNFTYHRLLVNFEPNFNQDSYVKGRRKEFNWHIPLLRGKIPLISILYSLKKLNSTALITAGSIRYFIAKNDSYMTKMQALEILLFLRVEHIIIFCKTSNQ